MKVHQLLEEEDGSMLLTMIKLLLSKGTDVYFNFKLLEDVQGMLQYVHYHGKVFMTKGQTVYARPRTGLEERIYFGMKDADEDFTLKKFDDGYQVVNMKPVKAFPKVPPRE
jgi:hypothetical protein